MMADRFRLGRLDIGTSSGPKNSALPTGFLVSGDDGSSRKTRCATSGRQPSGNPTRNRLKMLRWRPKKLGDFKTAEAFYLKCDKNFEPPSYFMNLSTLYFETQQFEKGADIMTQAIDAGCNDILCFKMRCFFRIESRDIPGALADFEQAMALFNAVPNAQPDAILNNLQMMLLPHLRGQ